MELKKTLEMNTLFDFYGKLLTTKQQDYMTYYYLEDHSLGEIAEESGVSRQAVFDNIKRSETILKNYENKLGLCRQFDKQHEQLAKLKLYVSQHYQNDRQLQALIDQLG